MNSLPYLLLTTSVLALTGCGPRLGASSCMLGKGAECMEYIGLGWSEDSARSSCGSAAYSTDNCPVQNLAGVCTRATGTTSETRTYFYSPPNDPSRASALCFQTGGVFSTTY